MISIHTLRVEGDDGLVTRLTDKLYISIHTLRVEGDTLNWNIRIRAVISIHTLRVEGDV